MTKHRITTKEIHNLACLRSAHFHRTYIYHPPGSSRKELRECKECSKNQISFPLISKFRNKSNVAFFRKQRIESHQYPNPEIKNELKI